MFHPFGKGGEERKQKEKGLASNRGKGEKGRRDFSQTMLCCGKGEEGKRGGEEGCHIEAEGRENSTEGEH